jgi:hypothetical protein
MTWWLVTEPDERDRCCVVRDGARCERRTAFRIESTDGAWDDYTYVCRDDVELVSGPGYLVTEVIGPPLDTNANDGTHAAGH